MNTKFSIAAWLLAAFLFFSGMEPARAQPVLTTVQDMVYLADGSRFNGLAYIEWKSFDAPNGAVIGQYSKVVRIVDGLLRAQLASTSSTTNAYYAVKYSSGGRTLFSEIWAVPLTTNILKLKDVRATLLPGGYVSAPNYGNSGGQPPISSGNSTSGVFVDAETPIGTVNGSNTVFTLSATPNPSDSMRLYRNGVLLSPTVDYTISASTITFLLASVPQTGDYLRAYYRTGDTSTAPHNLLSDTHTDSFSEGVQRGDIITGQNATTRWTRLGIGAANRCLTSNGVDAVWNTCLFTGFTPGAVPFITTGGIMAQDATSLFWDATNKRLSLGNGNPTANLTIQASPAQGTNHLSRWLNSGGTELARMEYDGAMVVQRLTTSTNSTRSAWRDSGSNVDPSARQNGDFWFNNSQQARKSYEAGQTHPLPQVLCSSTGGTTSSTASTQIGSCTIPAFFMDAGDRIEIEFNAEHTGTASGFILEFRFGASTVWSRTFASGETLSFTKASGGLHQTGAAWGVTNFGVTAAFAAAASNTTAVPTTLTVISFRANLGSASSDTVILRNYSVVRYPAQFNP